MINLTAPAVSVAHRGLTAQLTTRGRSEGLATKNNFKIMYRPITTTPSALGKNPSETKRSGFYSGIIKNSWTSEGSSAPPSGSSARLGEGRRASLADEWLVGMTDGDGTFHFSKTKKGIWSFTFKIAQSSYNLRLLYYIKSMLGVGSVSVPESKDCVAEFRIRNIQHIIEYLLPIFDKYPLLTSKHFSYTLFKKAILIMNDPSLSNEEKDTQITNLKLLAQIGPTRTISRENYRRARG